MGLDIIIQREPGYDLQDTEAYLATLNSTTIYHATYEATDYFREHSAAFKALTDFAYASTQEGDKVIVEPTQYSPLIPLFAEEMAILESLGKSDRGDPELNEITLYDCIVGCHDKLQKAVGLGKNIVII